MTSFWIAALRPTSSRTILLSATGKPPKLIKLLADMRIRFIRPPKHIGRRNKNSSRLCAESAEMGGRMISPATFARIVVVLCSLIGGDSAFAQSRPGVSDRTVGAGKSVVLIRLKTYESDRGCVPISAAVIDTSPKPKLGQVTSSFDHVLSDGPCGKMKYPVTTVIYQAGKHAGTEEIEVYFYFTRGRDSKTFRVTVAGGSASAKVVAPTVKAETSIRATKPKSITNLQDKDQEQLSKVEGKITGTFVNQHGNQMKIGDGILSFTGYWNKERVTAKPFALVEQTENKILWATYTCTGSNKGFKCLGSNGQENTYRRLSP
jgi:hypothetical protein